MHFEDWLPNDFKGNKGNDFSNRDLWMELAEFCNKLNADKVVTYMCILGKQMRRRAGCVWTSYDLFITDLWKCTMRLQS